jgi:hypothetical protein
VKLFAVALLVPLAALARKPPRGHHRPAPALDPARFFASRPGLVRVYEARAPSGDAELPRAGASCEVLEAKPRDSIAPGSMKESCTMIVGRKARPATQVTYELRKDGIWSVQVKTEGGQTQNMERLVLPSPLRVGSNWKEPWGETELDRTVKSAGGGCKAAGRSFADCLVLSVTERQGKKVNRKYTETYAAGVGLVENGQLELVDVKGL